MKKKLTLLIIVSIIAISIGFIIKPTEKIESASSEMVSSELEEERPPQEEVVSIEEETAESSVPEQEPSSEEEKVSVSDPEPTPPQTITEENSIPPIDTSFKSWMPYTAITQRGSAAYQLQQQAYTDENGLRKVGDDYCVAMGTFYSSTIGQRFRITMSTGNVFTVIISDVKADAHTDSTHRYTVSNHCMMEFLVDKSCLNSAIRLMGSVGALELFKGQFVKIEKLG